jgi:hypothetical protein
MEWSGNGIGKRVGNSYIKLGLVRTGLAVIWHRQQKGRLKD